MANERLIQRARDLAIFLEKRLVTNLIKMGIEATGELVRSVEVVVEQGLGSIDIVERHAFYGDFVDRGRRPGGKRIPVDVIEAWLKVKRFEWAMTNIRGKAFAVQTSIWQKGIKSKPWLTEVINTSGPIIAREVQVAAEEQMEVLIDNLVRFAQRQFAIQA